MTNANAILIRMTVVVGLTASIGYAAAGVFGIPMNMLDAWGDGEYKARHVGPRTIDNRECSEFVLLRSGKHISIVSYVVCPDVDMWYLVPPALV